MRRSSEILGLIAAGSLLIPSQGMAAGFTGSRTEWIDMPQAFKWGYASGAYDGLTLGFTSDDKATSAFKRGVTMCASELKLKSNDASKLIEDGYAADVGVWTYPATVVLYRQLVKMCRSAINAARQESGLGVLPPD